MPRRDEDMVGRGCSWTLFKPGLRVQNNCRVLFLSSVALLALLELAGGGLVAAV